MNEKIVDRRRLLTSLGLLAGAAYVAPMVLNISDAKAGSGPSKASKPSKPSKASKPSGSKPSGPSKPSKPSTPSKPSGPSKPGGGSKPSGPSNTGKDHNEREYDCCDRPGMTKRERERCERRRLRQANNCETYRHGLPDD